MTNAQGNAFENRRARVIREFRRPRRAMSRPNGPIDCVTVRAGDVIRQNRPSRYREPTKSDP
jgi:hypothetical protein